MPALVRRTSIGFGKIDAKSAMVTRDKLARSLFLDAFALPHPDDMTAISSGDKYIIYGSKGSGKTALLRYLMEKENKNNFPTKFIVFSEDIATQDIDNILNQDKIDAIDKPDIGELINVKDMWSIYIVKCVCELLNDRKDMFDDSDKNKKLLDIVESAFDSSKRGILSSIIRSMKSGKLRFSAKIAEFAEFEAAVNIENDGEVASIEYSRFADVALKRLCSMEFPADVKYCLFIDEINLSMLQQKQHKKDSIVIRDLILTIGKINRIFVERNVPIYIYAAIRNEVAKVSNISRNEIDKYLLDHGYKTHWHEGLNVGRYPIFSIIEKRIMAIEKQQVGKTSDRESIWKDYFARDIFGVETKRFLSEITWCNPRDIVNLFNLASTVEMHRDRYDSNVFTSIADQYSEAVWSERAEELNAEHSMTVVNAIKRLLSGFHRHFKMDVLEKHAQGMAIANPIYNQILNTVGMEKICKDLYYTGVLGQSIFVDRSIEPNSSIHKNKISETWFYRDNREFDSSQWLIVHRGLYPALKMGRWNANVFGVDPRIVV